MSQIILARISGELAQYHRGRHRAGLDRHQQPQDTLPMILDRLHIDQARDQRGKLGWHADTRYRVKTLFFQIPDAWRKPKAKQSTNGKYMVGEPTGVGVMFVDDEAAFVIQQAIQDIRCLVSGRRQFVLVALAVVLFAPIAATEFAAVALIRQPRMPADWITLACAIAALFGQAFLFLILRWL